MFHTTLPMDDEPVEVYLTCDPAIQRENEQAALVKYIQTGDVSLIKVPDDAQPVLLKALTPVQVSKAAARAGKPPYLGFQVSGMLDSHSELKELRGVLDEMSSKYQQLAEDDDSKEKLGAELEQVAQQYDMARALFFEEMPSSHEQAYREYLVWIEERALQVMLEALVDFPFMGKDGQRIPREQVQQHKQSLLERIQPPKMQSQVQSELVLHATRLSSLGAEGKALYALEPGSGA